MAVKAIFRGELFSAFIARLTGKTVNSTSSSSLAK